MLEFIQLMNEQGFFDDFWWLFDDFASSSITQLFTALFMISFTMFIIRRFLFGG